MGYGRQVIEPSGRPERSLDQGGMTISRETQLDRVQREWDRLGREDPLWAIVSVPDKRGGGWNPSEFFRTGEERVAEVLEVVRSRGISIRPGTALDFGCGVGRLTQALAEEFEHVVGVDVSPAMVDGARRYNLQGDRVRYLLNASPDLRQFESGAFSFVLADIVLQHIPPRLTLGYVAEFVRVLGPAGVAAFQLPSGPVSPWLAWIPSRLLDPVFNAARNLSRRVRGPPSAGWESHWIPRSRVRRAVARAGGRVLAVIDFPPVEGKLRNHTYLVARANDDIDRTTEVAPDGPVPVTADPRAP